MSGRAEFWYVFGLVALLMVLLRGKSVRRLDWRDPIAVSFTAGIFLSIFGVFAKQPFLAGLIDTFLGINAAWVLADSFFISGMCALTSWIDRLRQPDGEEQVHHKPAPWRWVALAGVIGLMAVVAILREPVWSQLERGGIDVGGDPLVLLSRLAYFTFDIWVLSYLSYRFYGLRKRMQERISYIRLTLAWLAVSLAAIAPILQAVATLAGYVQPSLIANLWALVWPVVSLLQVVVALLVLTLFFKPAYQAVTWLDKQRLIRRLSRIRAIITQLRPDILPESATTSVGLFVNRPDQYLAMLVNELEMASVLMGAQPNHLAAPAGGLMPDPTRAVLQSYQQQLQRALTDREPLNLPAAKGDIYALARWYAHLARPVAAIARK